MTDDLQEIDGVGPSREEDLEKLGYDTYEALAGAEPETLAEDVPRLSEDKALELVVQAENLTDLEEAKVSETTPEEVEGTDDPDPSVEDEPAPTMAEEDSEPTEDEPAPTMAEEDDMHEIELVFETDREYDAFFNTLYEQRNTLLRTNRGGKAERYTELLDEMRVLTPEEPLTVEMTADDLNDLHNAVRSSAVSYQGQGLIQEMEALNRFENEVNSSREKHLF